MTQHLLAVLGAKGRHGLGAVFPLGAQPRAPATNQILASHASQICGPSGRAPLAPGQTPGVSGDVARCFWNVYLGEKVVEKQEQIKRKIKNVLHFWLCAHHHSAFLCYTERLWDTLSNTLTSTSDGAYAIERTDPLRRDGSALRVARGAE